MYGPDNIVTVVMESRQHRQSSKISTARRGVRCDVEADTGTKVKVVHDASSLCVRSCWAFTTCASYPFCTLSGVVFGKRHEHAAPPGIYSAAVVRCMEIVRKYSF